MGKDVEIDGSAVMRVERFFSNFIDQPLTIKGSLLRGTIPLQRSMIKLQ